MKEYHLISMLPGLLLVVFGIMAQGYWTELRWFHKRALDKSIGNDRRSKYVKNYHKAFILFRLICIAGGLCLVAWFIPLFVSSRASFEITKYMLIFIALIIVLVLGIKFGGKHFLYYIKSDNFLRLLEQKKRKVRGTGTIA